MKKLVIIYSLLAVFVVGCRKEDNPKLPELERVPVPLVVKDASADAVISAVEPASFAGKFSVDLYFKDDIKPQKFDVVVIKNGNKSNVKVIKADVTTFPTVIDITGTQLKDLFGAEIVLNDQFDIGVDVTTQSGKKYEAFSTTGVNYGAGVASQPGASLQVRYTAVCVFDASRYGGSFEVVEDEWADYAPGTVIPVTVINDHQLSFEYNCFDPQPIIVNVNTATNETSVAKQVYGNYGAPPGWPYGDISCESIPSLDNFVAPCDGIISVRLKHTVAAGSFGDAKIVLKKIE